MAYLRSESFSERAFKALNISTTTSTVIATVMGSWLLNDSQSAVHFEEFSSLLQVNWGPFYTDNRYHHLAVHVTCRPILRRNSSIYSPHLRHSYLMILLERGRVVFKHCNGIQTKHVSQTHSLERPVFAVAALPAAFARTKAVIISVISRLLGSEAPESSSLHASIKAF